MNHEKNHLNCKYFDTAKCPERKNEPMKRFISDTSIYESTVPIILKFGDADEINMLCSKCDAFNSH